MRNDLRYDIDLHQVKRQERNVCLGSLADIRERTRGVRFTPESGHAERHQRRPLSAISGHPRAA